MKIKFLNAALVGLALSVSCLVNVANAGFISPDEALILTGGDLGGDYDIGNTIDGSGLSVHDETGTLDGATINMNIGTAFYSRGNNTGSALFSFYSNKDIDGFYLWNPVHFGTHTHRGIRDFTLEFFSGTSSLGITSTLTATQYLLNQPTYSAESFTGFSFQNVSSIILTVDSNWGDLTYWSMHEVGFGGSDTVGGGGSIPEPSTLAIFALGLIGLASRRFKK